MHADVERLESTWPQVPAAYAAVPAAFPAHPGNAQALAPTAASQQTEPKHPEEFAERADAQSYWKHL